MMKRHAMRLVTLLFTTNVVLFSVCAQAETHCDCSSEPAAGQALIDDALKPSPERSEASTRWHLPWGPPLADKREETLTTLVGQHLVLGYDTELRSPVWSGHRLGAEDLDHRIRAMEASCDPRIRKDDHAVTCADYEGADHELGFLSSPDDFARGFIPQALASALTNAVPMDCAFRHGPWRLLEDLTRFHARQKGELYVINGAIHDRWRGNEPQRMVAGNGTKRVAVATHFYKILVHERASGQLEILSMLLPHDATDFPRDHEGRMRFIEAHVTTVDDLEKLAVLNFFPRLQGLVRGRVVEREPWVGEWPLPDELPRMRKRPCK